MRRHGKPASSDGGNAGWKHLEHFHALGHSVRPIFRDWLFLIRSAHLSFTDNLARGLTDPSAFNGEYEARYLELVERYKSNRPIGERPIDHFTEAYAELLKETIERREDVLGALYENNISFGENGQFFIPTPLTDLMAAIVGSKSGTVSDPAGFGSGRTLIAAGKRNPAAHLLGIDLDERCAMMATVNMLIFGFSAEIIWGNDLTDELYRSWRVHSDGSITEHSW